MLHAFGNWIPPDEMDVEWWCKVNVNQFDVSFRITYVECIGIVKLNDIVSIIFNCIYLRLRVCLWELRFTAETLPYRFLHRNDDHRPLSHCAVHSLRRNREKLEKILSHFHRTIRLCLCVSFQSSGPWHLHLAMHNNTVVVSCVTHNPFLSYSKWSNAVTYNHKRKLHERNHWKEER